MASSYPNAIDALTNPSGTDPMTSPAHAGQHSDANDAIEAIETTLGASVQGVYSTVRERIEVVEAAALSASAFALSASVSASIATQAAFESGTYAASALQAFRNFEVVYLGASAANFVTDKDGGPLITGALYFNTADDDMKVYTAASAWESVSASAVAAFIATDALYEEFDRRYLGAKSTPPTVDNEGDPLIVGALYYDENEFAMKVWTGSAWINAADSPYSWTGPISISASSASPALLITQLGSGDVLRLNDEGSDTSPLTISSTGALLTYSTVTASSPGRFQGHGAVTQCTSTTRPGSPEEGDIIYETDTDLFYGWNGAEWSSIGGGSIAYQTTPPTTNLSDGTLWVDSDGESTIVNANDFYTKTETDGLLESAGFNPFFKIG
jgi:hypothetical protein